MKYVCKYHSTLASGTVNTDSATSMAQVQACAYFAVLHGLHCDHDLFRLDLLDKIGTNFVNIVIHERVHLAITASCREVWEYF